MPLKIFIAAWLLALAVPALVAQDFRLERDRLVVEEEHWRQWSHPLGSIEFSAAGLRPRFVRAQVNATTNADRFVNASGQRGGIRNAGSRSGQAARVLDGDEASFWEPDLEAPLADWWVEIDLGRAVWAQKIVVKFAPQGQGDPFLQFRVLTANGLPAFPQSKALNYVVAGRSEGLNKRQRVFEFELTPTVEADPGLQGDLIQFVQILATASDRGQAEEVGEQEWNELPESERGDVLYFRRETTGILRRVDRSEYEALADAQRRGPVRHFRRELPRLAEVEVWTVGDNLSLGALDRGGEIVGYGNLGSEVLTIDGDYSTFWSVEVGFASQGFGGDLTNVVVQDPERQVLFDLGSWFWVNRAFIVFDRLSSGGAFPNYVVNLSDGSKAPDGSLLYTPLGARGNTGQEEELNNRIFLQDNAFPLTRARYFKMDYRIVNRSIRSGIREIQLYGEGFQPRVSLTSGLMELGQAPRILSTIDWHAEEPPGTRLEIRTRSGNEVARQIRYFTKAGVEVRESEYRKLLSFQRGDSLITFVPGADWSNWSQFYVAPGAAITSPSPRRYAMVQATLVSNDPERAVTLRDLSIQLIAPLASRLVGEVQPVRVERGRREEFTLFLRPTFLAGNRGFDQVLIELPPGARVELLEVATGSESLLQSQPGRVYGAEQLEKVPTGQDSVWVRLPERVGGQEHELVALRLAGNLYLASNAFVVQVGLGQGAEAVWQRVDAGEATALGEGRSLTVFTPFGGRVMGDVQVAPNPFTPNGDGINDAVEIHFPVFNIQQTKMLVLEIYSLDGRRLRRLEKQVEFAAGQQSMGWDGRDQGGGLVPPGLYICRVGLEVDAETIAEPVVSTLVAVVH